MPKLVYVVQAWGSGPALFSGTRSEVVAWLLPKGQLVSERYDSDDRIRFFHVDDGSGVDRRPPVLPGRVGTFPVAPGVTSYWAQA